MGKGCAVPLSDRWVVYDPLRGVSALVNEEAVKAVLAADPKSDLDPVSELADALKAEPAPAPAPRSGSLRADFLGLIPTRTCNLACQYCDFNAAGSVGEMSLDLASAAVSWMARHVAETGGKILEVQFFGGEPFAAPDVVETAVHCARQRAFPLGLQTRFEATTNGCFGERQRAFVADYFHSIMLSCDGPEDVHNLHRPGKDGQGSFATVAKTARALSDSPVELCLRACVTDQTVDRLEEIVEWFLKNFRPSLICVEPLKPTDDSTAAGLRPPDPWAFAAHYWRARAIAAARGVETVYAAASIQEVRHTFCPVARDTVIVSPDGRIGACYLPEATWIRAGLDLNFGRITPSGEMRIDEDALERIRNLSRLPARCRRCLAQWHCAGGCHVCQSSPGCGDDYNDFCLQTRLILVFQLLEELGCADQAASLMEDRGRMERLARHPSDLLSDWPC
jgi:uncharacterized protein